MVTVIRTAEDLKKVIGKNGDFVFDTTMKVNEETGETELSLDIKSIVLNGNVSTCYSILENTMKSFKNKKEKALFVNTVIRKLGTDMWISDAARWDGASLYGKTYSSDFGGWLVTGMLLSKYGTGEEILDSDARLVLKIADNLHRELPMFNSMRFDANNPLHQKLANKAMLLEKNGNDYFKGFTDRWMKDTQPTRYMKNKKETASGKDSVDVITKLHDKIATYQYDHDHEWWLNRNKWNDFQKLAFIMKKENFFYRWDEWHRFDDFSKLTIIKWLIQNAPADQEWCLRIGNMLTNVKDLFRGKAKGKATMLQDTHKVVMAFTEKYDAVIEKALADLEQAQLEQQEADADLNNREKINKDRWQIIKDLDEKKHKWDEYRYDLRLVRNDFYNSFVRVDTRSDKEKSFYTKIYEELCDKVDTFLEKADSGVLTEIHIQGQPWTLWGTKEQKKKLQLANDTMNRYNELIKNVPEKYDYADRDTRDNTKRMIGRDDHDLIVSKNRLSAAQRELREIERFIDEFKYTNQYVKDVKTERGKVYQNAKQKLEEKRKKTPRVESGYNAWSTETNNAQKKRELNAFAKKIKPSNPGLTDEQLLELAAKILSEKNK